MKTYRYFTLYRNIHLCQTCPTKRSPTVYSRPIIPCTRRLLQIEGNTFIAASTVIYRCTHRWPTRFFCFAFDFLVGFGSVPDPGGQNPRTICNFPLGMPQELQHFLPRVPRGRRRGKRRRVQDKSWTVCRFPEKETPVFSVPRSPGRHCRLRDRATWTISHRRR